MEDIYMIEFLITNISLQCKSGKVKSSSKKLTVNLDFGKFASFIVNESEFEKEQTNDDDVSIANHLSGKQTESNITLFELDINEEEKQSQNKSFNSGASILFPLNPDGLKQTFRLFPLDITVWTNDETENRACVGSAKVMWDSEFLELVTISSKTCKILPPVTIKSVQILRSDITGSVIGEITSLVRLTCFGRKIITRFKTSGSGRGFIFRNRAGNGSHKCKIFGPKNDNPVVLNTIGILYESLEIEDPDVVKADERKKVVSSELKAAGLDEDCVMFITGDQMRQSGKQALQVALPCGNANCKLTRMIQSYLTQGETIKLGSAPGPCQVGGAKPKSESGGCCACSADPPQEVKECGATLADQPKYVICEVCGGYSNSVTCKDKDPCPGLCFLNCNTSSKKEVNVQRMLYDGLTKILKGSKTNMREPLDSSKKGSCCR